MRCAVLPKKSLPTRLRRCMTTTISEAFSRLRLLDDGVIGVVQVERDSGDVESGRLGCDRFDVHVGKVIRPGTRCPVRPHVLDPEVGRDLVDPHGRAVCSELASLIDLHRPSLALYATRC